MNVSTAELKLKEKRKWWEATAEHTIEQATMDPQSNFTYRLAMEKLAAINCAERRITLGTFGRCDCCGGVIEEDRLESILDDECHYCTACAIRLSVAHTVQKATRTLNGYRVSSHPALQMA